MSTREAAIVQSVCDGTQSQVGKEHRGHRGHKDAGIKQTLLRGDP